MTDRVKRTLWTLEPKGAAFIFEKLFWKLKLWENGQDTPLAAQDVLFFDGGADINPDLYGEKQSVFTRGVNRYRDAREKSAFVAAQSAGAACLGSCRGAQLLCALSGGKLIQHVEGHLHGHNITTKYREVMMAQGDHHQQMWPFSTDHALIAWASRIGTPFDEYQKRFYDDVEPEIVWFPQTKSLAIQAHPEYHTPADRFPKFCHELVEDFILKGHC